MCMCYMKAFSVTVSFIWFSCLFLFDNLFPSPRRLVTMVVPYLVCYACLGDGVVNVDLSHWMYHILNLHRHHHHHYHHYTTWSGDMGLERRRESASRGSRESEADSGVGVSATERRFAYSLLEKLLEYLDNASVNMQQMRPSSRFSRRESYSTATEDVKFFGKVI